MSEVTPEINLAEIASEVDAMSQEDIAAQLIAIKARQKVQQKKNQGSGAQKAYQLKQREKVKLLKKKALELGLMDNINKEAEKKAEEKLAAEAASDDGDEG